MIEHTVIDGRKATVTYMHRADWSLADPDEADFAKVVFEDGDVLFITPAGKQSQQAQDYSPQQRRNPKGHEGGGKFTKNVSPLLAQKQAANKGKVEAKKEAVKSARGQRARELVHKQATEISQKLGPVAERAEKYAELKRSGNAHPGKGYSASAVLDEHGIIHTDDVSDVARALYQGRNVNLISPDKVSIAIDHLGKVASRMAKGGFKGTFDLCRVTLENTSLFCVELKGIPRVKMPQLKGKPLPGSLADKMPKNEKGEVDLNPLFRERLEKLGHKIEDVDERADHLKATQNELNGQKVAGMANAIRQGKIADERLFVSHDNYIVDGHHRWGAKVAVDYDDGLPGHVTQPVARVDAGIVELLAHSLKYAQEMGIPQAAVGGLDNSLAQHPMVTGEKSKPISGVAPGTHPSVISPSVTATNKATDNSEEKYVPTGAKTMRAGASTTTWSAEDAKKTATEKAKREEPYHFNLKLHKNSAAYAGMRPEELEGTPIKVERNIVNRMKDNLRSVWNHATDADKLSASWYRSANRIIKKYASTYKLNDASVAGVFAALSPQKDWDMNVYLAQSILDIWGEQQDTQWDDLMELKARELFERRLNKKSKKYKETLAANRLLIAKISKPGTTLGSLKGDDMAVGMWIRTYEETYGDPTQPLNDNPEMDGKPAPQFKGKQHERGYRYFNPDGGFGDFHTNLPKTDEERDNPVKGKVAWQTQDAVANAVSSMFSDGDRHVISNAMGDVHKVRNFYNNLVDPDGKNGDVTINSHAIGAAWLKPLAPYAKAHGLATGPNKEDQQKNLPGWKAARDNVGAGSKGTYGFYADAYRELADELGILPDELQAILWVTKRNAFVGMADDNIKLIDDEWMKFHNGQQELEETQDKVWNIVDADHLERAMLEKMGMSRKQYATKLAGATRREERKSAQAGKKAKQGMEKANKQFTTETVRQAKEQAKVAKQQTSAMAKAVRKAIKR